MRKFIDIIEKAFVASKPKTKFKPLGTDIGSAALSRTTDPEEQIEFKVFALPQDADAIQEIIARFSDVEFHKSESSKLFAKTTFLCRGIRHHAEAVARAVKMSRIKGAVARID